MHAENLDRVPAVRGEKEMRRPWVMMIATVMALMILLFVGDYFGRTDHEMQDPYSRLVRKTGSRFGISYDTIERNAMSDYFYDTLKQPRSKIQWQDVKNDHVNLGGEYKSEVNQVAPVVLLEPDIEVQFLQALPNKEVRLAVIHSLFQPRKPGSDPKSRQWNDKEFSDERDRVYKIGGWFVYARNNTAVPFHAWWQENAAVFGITPDGKPLPAPPVTPPAAGTGYAPDTSSPAPNAPTTNGSVSH